MIEQDILTKVVKETLQYVPYKPFLCLPMSAIAYTVLKDNHGIVAKFVTGDLSYKGHSIFKQDFSVTSVQSNTFQEWSGHAWLDIEGVICDLSFFRTCVS